MLTPYNSLVNTHFESLRQFWFLNYRNNVDLFERVPRHATKIMKFHPYEEQLERLSFSNEKEASKGDLVLSLTYLKKFSNVDHVQEVKNHTNPRTPNNGQPFKKETCTSHWQEFS